jgi:AraC-like DNA-binding protein/quercetin dioxygenase-like cupin family protein
MVGAEQRALHQSFLPKPGERAFVWKYSPSIGGRRPRHFHIEPELNLVVRGTATFGVGDRVVRVSEGELLVFPSGQDHVLLEGSEDLYLYALGLEPRYSAEVLGGRAKPVLPLHAALPPDELSVIQERVGAIVDRSGAEQEGAELWERIHWLGRRSVERSGRRGHVLTRRALELLDAAPELGLEELAGELRANPTEVSRHFHRDLGMTLVRYRTRLRLLRFIHAVDSGERDLMTTAITAGFGSYSQCHRSFQAELGCAPRQYFRSEVREQMQRTYEG